MQHQCASLAGAPRTWAGSATTTRTASSATTSSASTRSPTGWAGTWAASGPAGWRSRSSSARLPTPARRDCSNVSSKDVTPGRHPVAALLRRAVIEADRHLRDGDGQPRSCRDGDHADGLAVRRRSRAHGTRGRLARLPLRNGRARQLSEDHSWIQEQVRAGLISPEEAKESRFETSSPGRSASNRASSPTCTAWLSRRATASSSAPTGSRTT